MKNSQHPPTQRRRARTQRGSILIEFCVSAIILLMLFAGAADFGRLFYYSDLVINAARAGTQYCVAQMGTATCTSNNPSAWTPPSAIAAAAANEKGSTNISVIVATPVMTCLCSTSSGLPTTGNCSGTCSGTWEEWVQVNTSYTFNTLIAWPNIPQSTVLRGTSSIEVQ